MYGELGAAREALGEDDGREKLEDGLERLAEGAVVGRAAAGAALALWVVGCAVPPELQPRDCAVAAEPGAPDLLSRLESGCHFCDGCWPRLMFTSPLMLTLRSMFTLLLPPYPPPPQTATP